MNTGSGDRCIACDEWISTTRMTLARAKTGDLAFCGWACMEQWRMNKVQRVNAEYRFVSLVGQAIVRRHPQAVWLAERGYVGRTGLTDRALEAAIERLDAWLAEHPTPLEEG